VGSLVALVNELIVLKIVLQSSLDASTLLKFPLYLYLSNLCKCLSLAICLSLQMYMLISNKEQIVLNYSWKMILSIRF
jgi:hypothetical protein